MIEYQVAGIVELANKPFADPALEADRQLRIAGNLESRLGMSELIQLFRMRDREKYHQRNSALTVQEVDFLDRELRNFLIAATSKQHHQRIIDKINQIEKATASGAPEREMDVLLRDFASLATAARQFKIHEHPEYLNLEYQGNILIFGSQVANQDRIASFQKREGTDQENGAAVEAIPGSGKTAVHTTIQALNDADAEHAAIVVMPEALMPQMSQELQIRFGDAYDQSVEMMEFDRNDKFDQDALKRIVVRLESMIENRKVLLITDSSVQSLVLKFVEKALVSATSKGQDLDELKNEIALLRQIFTILREKGIVTVDEMHLIFDVLKAHHFTLGEQVPLKEEVVYTTTEFYRLLGSHPEIQKTVNFGFLPGQEGAPFTPEHYYQNVQPIIVQSILNGEILKNDKEFSAFLSGLDEKSKILLTDYLKNIRNPEASALVDQIPSMRLKNILAVLKEETSQLLPLTAKKRLGEHYGVLPKDLGKAAKLGRTDTLLSIPYHGSNNPVVQAQFGTDLEIIHYTIQMHLGNGISEDIVRQEIKHLADNIKDELTRGIIKSVEESPSYQAFLRLCGGNTQFALFNLEESDYAAITNAANKNIDVQVDLIRRYVLTQLKSYMQQLHTNGQIYSAIFQRIRGYSGTLWNADAFPDTFYEIFLSDSMARTLHILWENSPQKVTTVKMPNTKDIASEDEKARLIVDAIYSDGFQGAFTDLAGLAKDITDNEVMARALLSKLDASYEGVAYYTNNDKLYVLVRGQESGVPIEQCGVPKEKLSAYWDQKHNTGADIKLGSQLRTKVPVGQHTMLFSLIQAVWRLRQLDAGQIAEFVVEEEDRKVISDTLKRITGKEVGEELTLGDLLVYTMYNQAMRQGDDNHRSMMQKMQMLLINKIISLVIDPSIGEEDLAKIFEETKGLFVSFSSPNPYEIYGRTEEFANSKEVVEQELQQFMDSAAMKAFATNPILRERFSLDEIKVGLQKIVDTSLAKLPNQLVSGTRYDTEVAVEVQAEAKKEAEQETQKQRQVEMFGDQKLYEKGFPDIMWSPEDVFSKSSFMPASKAKLEGAGLPSTIAAMPVSQFKAKGISPVVKVSEFLSKDNDVFDSDLLATVNMMPVYISKSFFGFFDKQPPYEPFGKYEDVTSNVLVIEDKHTGHLQMVLADQEDAGQFRNLLQKDLKDPSQANREMRVCLYNLASEIAFQGSDSFEVDKLKADPNFVKLSAQAKFYRGFLSYSEAEQKALAEWIQSKGVDKMRAFFENVVLSSKPTAKESFPGSNIGNLFTSLE